MMKNKSLALYVSSTVFFFSYNLYAGSSKPISIDEVMRLTEINSPRISATRLREMVASKSIDIAQANYFPTLNAEAIDSTGFSGSSGALGLDGLTGSPYRSGAAAGLVAQQVIWDFGRTFYDVELSRREVGLSKQNTRVTQYQIKQLALEVYYDCAYYKTQSENWGHLSHESNIITKEAHHFVDTGQVSIVDRYLSKAQTEEAQTAQAYFAERYKKSILELAVIMGVSEQAFTCPSLPSRLSESLYLKQGNGNSPLVDRAIADTKVAHAHLQKENAGYYPKIVAIASIGAMESAQLVKKKEYAAGIGIIWPIFDLHTNGNVQKAKAELIASNQDVEAARNYLREMNAKYDGVIQSSIVRLRHLDTEYALATDAFKTAKKRYFTLEGQLIDLREAFRNIARVESQIEETRTKMLQARGSKALLNGSGSS